MVRFALFAVCFLFACTDGAYDERDDARGGEFPRVPVTEAVKPRLREIINTTQQRLSGYSTVEVVFTKTREERYDAQKQTNFPTENALIHINFQRALATVDAPGARYFDTNTALNGGNAGFEQLSLETTGARYDFWVENDRSRPIAAEAMYEDRTTPAFVSVTARR